MRRFISFSTVLLIILFSCTKEAKMKDTVREYMNEKIMGFIKDDGDTYSVYKIEIALDTIPIYLNPSVLKAADDARFAVDFLKNLDSPAALWRERATGEPYYLLTSKGKYTEENAYQALEYLEYKLDSLQMVTVPAITYVGKVEIVDKCKYGTYYTSWIVILDKDNPDQVIDSFAFSELNKQALMLIKIAELKGDLKYDALGNVSMNGWYDIEKYLLKDKVKEYSR